MKTKVYTYDLGSLLITSIAAGSETISHCNIGAADPVGAIFDRRYVMYAAAVVCERKYKNWSPANRRGKITHEMVAFEFLKVLVCTQIGGTLYNTKAIQETKFLLTKY